MMAPRTVLKNFHELILFSIVLAIVLEAVKGGKRSVTWSNNVNEDGFVTSPNYPNNYPDNYEGIWKFKVPQDHRVELEFVSFELEAHDSCNYDYVAVFDGPLESHPLLGKFCGSKTPSPIIKTTAGEMLMIFRTDGSNVRKGFKVTHKTKLNLKGFVPSETQRNVIQYFLNSRQQINNINKCGTDITRTAIAVFFHDSQFFSAGNETGEEITYELTLQLMSKLVMKKRISTKDLALFVNAMTVACIKPEKFFGLNIVAELRRRVDNSNLTNPFFILVLCLAGDNMTMEDVFKLQLLFDADLRPSWTETQAMVVMAVECISRKSEINLNTILDAMVLQIKRKQQNNGRVENLKTTALVIQTLVATDRYGTNFNMSMAVKSIVKDMENTHLSTEEMYHLLAIIKEKTLLDISSIHCGNFTETDFHEVKTEIQKHPDERVQIQVSVIIGDDMDFTRTWRIKIPSNYSFYQALENIGSSDSHFKVQYTILEGKPYIAGLASYKDSTEDGLFWFIYTKPISSNHHPVLVEESPVDIPVSVTDELILWYRSVPWHITQEITTDASSSDIPFTETTDYPLNFTDV